ncbi:SMP-30/gluconolactonase/LRE family protein [Agromyces silvae]|uniref:SMP-30/gluconolactonase/LRE family protein n=1 Tax=Agromyces silvae TaxID=3388266 RepID=UPI00280AC716|nr:SMP-30/gluconolactonase/LRE family protein [Agromyces protaetiae]
MIAEQLTDPVVYHGEGAHWHEPWGGVRWVDMLAGDVLFRSDATGEIRRTPTGSRVAAMVRPRTGGGLVVATERGFLLWDAAEREEWRSADLIPADARFNEGAIDPLGRVLCGTIHDSREPGSADVWRLGVDRGATRILDGVTISNGLGFAADGSRAFYVDSRTRRVDVFDVDADGELVARRPFVVVPDEVVGNPDGLCVDAEGGVWVAFYNGGAARHYDRDGRLDAVVEVPGVSRVTSCALGGSSGTTLYLTTSREGLDDEAEPSAGALFVATADAPAVPVREAAL